ncbi:MAG: metallophosphoesterase [Desulfurococcales archaeon]|nr:metallophosphoesterase [Desulfurococcales archaeon]
MLLATGDIHSPRFLPLLREALAGAGEAPCLLLLAGDVVDRGRAEMVEPVVRLIEQRLPGVPIAAVYGNEEYEESRPALLRLTRGRVAWLDDEYRVWDCPSGSVAVVGTTGALDRLTRWQRRHRPELARVYRERPRVVGELIGRARREADRVVLLSHYGLARATLKGEDPRVWPELYSSAMERLLARARPDAAVHGHAHRGTPRAVVAGVPVYNVALPLNRRLVAVRARRGLEGFL